MARATAIRAPSLAEIALLLLAALAALAAVPTEEAVRHVQAVTGPAPIGAAASRRLLQATPAAAPKDGAAPKPSPAPASEPESKGRAQWVTVGNYGAFREHDEMPKLKDGVIKLDKVSQTEFKAAPARGRRL